MTSTTTYKSVIAILTIALAISASTARYFALRALIQPSSTASKPNPVLSTGSLRVPYNSISYLPFSIETAPATLNITFSITDYNSYYPQSVALYLLTQNQYNTFQSGDHTSSTWYHIRVHLVPSSQYPVVETGISPSTSKTQTEDSRQQSATH